MTTFRAYSQCEFCCLQRSNVNSRQFKEHYNIHLGQEFNCELCDKKFPSKQKLQNHIRFAHGVKLECKVCHVTFSNNQNLNRHHKTKHLSEVMTYLCEHCNKQFIRKDKLDSHTITCQQVSMRTYMESSNNRSSISPYVAPL